MEKKANGLLKVVGILMIIFGALGMIFGLIAVIGVGALAALLGADANVGLLTVAAILYLIGTIITFIAGIVGVKNAAKPEKAQTCIIFGILAAAFSVLGNILTMVGGGSFNAFGLLSGLVIPVLYLIGAFQNKKLAQ